MFDEDLSAVITEAGGLGDGVTPESHFNGLDDAGKAGFTEQAKERRMVRNVSKAVIDSVTPALGKSVDTSLDAKLPDLITKLVHQRIDAAGIKPNDGAGPNAGKPGDGKPPVKDDGKGAGAKSADQVELEALREGQKKLQAQYLQGQVNNKVLEIIGAQGVDFVNDRARLTAIEKLTQSAKLGEDGVVSFNLDVDITGGGSELRSLDAKGALATLRGQEKYLFKGDPLDGTGGGGGAGGASGAPDALPANIGYRDLVQDAAMFARFKNEAPERLVKIKEAFEESPQGKKYADTLSGKGRNNAAEVDKILNS